MKKTIRMNERELHRLISESVKRTLNESHLGTIDLTQEFDEFTDTLANAWNNLNYRFVYISPDKKNE